MRAILVSLTIFALLVPSAAQAKDYGPCAKYDEDFPVASREYDPTGPVQLAPTFAPDEGTAKAIHKAWAAQYNEQRTGYVQAVRAAVGKIVEKIVRGKTLPDPVAGSLVIFGSAVLDVVTKFIPAGESRVLGGGLDADGNRVTRENLLGAGEAVAGVKSGKAMSKLWDDHWKEVELRTIEQFLEAFDEQLDPIKTHSPATFDLDENWPEALRARAYAEFPESMSHRQAEWMCTFIRQTRRPEFRVNANRVEFSLLLKLFREQKAMFGLAEVRLPGVFVGQGPPIAEAALASAEAGEIEIRFVSKHLQDHISRELHRLIVGGCGGRTQDPTRKSKAIRCPVYDPCSARVQDLALDEEVFGMVLHRGPRSSGVAARKALEVAPFCGRYGSGSESGNRPPVYVFSTQLEPDDPSSEVQVQMVDYNSSVFDLGIPVSFSIQIYSGSLLADSFLPEHQRMVFLPNRRPQAKSDRYLSYGVQKQMAERILDKSWRFTLQNLKQPKDASFF